MMTPRGPRSTSSGKKVVHRKRVLRSNRENYPVRNLDKEITNFNGAHLHHEKKVAKSKAVATHQNALSNENVNKRNRREEHPVLLPVLNQIRYNLRSLSKSSESTDDRLSHQSRFYKSILTPSRTISTDKHISNRARYRTPQVVTDITNFEDKTGRNISKQQRDIWNIEIGGLLNKTWKTSYLSSTIAFKYRRKNLKRTYESLLKAHVLEVYPAYQIWAHITPTSLLNQNPSEVDGVFFKIIAIQPQVDADAEEETILTIYEAFLLKTNAVQTDRVPGVEWYPLLLHRGLENIHHTFVSWFQSSFGCYITPRHLPQGCMLWLAGLWSDVKCSKKNHATTINFQYLIKPACTEVKFKFPNDKGRITMKVTCPDSDIKEVWNRIRKERTSLASAEEIIRFHRVMGQYMVTLCHLPECLLHLHQLRTPCMTLSSDGRVRLTCEKKFASILLHLMEIFLETCHFKNIDFDPVNTEENEDTQEFDLEDEV